MRDTLRLKCITVALKHLYRCARELFTAWRLHIFLPARVQSPCNPCLYPAVHSLVCISLRMPPFGFHRNELWSHSSRIGHSTPLYTRDIGKCANSFGWSGATQISQPQSRIPRYTILRLRKKDSRAGNRGRGTTHKHKVRIFSRRWLKLSSNHIFRMRIGDSYMTPLKPRATLKIVKFRFEKLTSRNVNFFVHFLIFSTRWT